MRGPEGARAVIVYGDYECPFCAVLEEHLRELELRVTFRHFPVRSSHPRAQAAAHAAEAAARQGAFWPFHDALFADQGRLEDPHLWARAERLGLDVARFDADRRSDEVTARVREHFRAGVRAGDVEYQAVLGRGWLSPWAEGGQFCGSRGMALPILGLGVRLRGAAAERFEAVVSARFTDGAAAGPITDGAPCEAASLAPLEAFLVELRPRASAKRAARAARAPR